MTPRIVVLALLAFMAWTAMVSAAATGIVAMVTLDRFIAAPDGALAICEVVQRTP